MIWLVGETGWHHLFMYCCSSFARFTFLKMLCNLKQTINENWLCHSIIEGTLFYRLLYLKFNILTKTTELCFQIYKPEQFSRKLSPWLNFIATMLTTPLIFIKRWFKITAFFLGFNWYEVKNTEIHQRGSYWNIK